MEIRETSVTELVSNEGLPALLEAYAKESSIEGMPKPRAAIDMYLRGEKAGLMKFFAAFSGGRVVGLVILLTTFLPHYSDKVSTLESFFVLKSYRDSGAGLRLLALAKAHAKGLGARGLLISAPFGGKLAKVLETSRAFIQSNQVFFTRLS